MLSYKELYNACQQCTKCALANGRTNLVFGEGNIKADIMFVGEGPGHDEDMQGRPFVGRAGQLLTRMIEAINLKREDVYIANIVKCRPPNNRVPYPEEAQACLPYLRNQYAIIRPSIIVCLGATAGRYILSSDLRITRDRGIWTVRNGCHMIATYHPAALLRDTDKKKDAWEDLKKVRDKYNELISDKHKCDTANS
jgi:uracil-DNA glycosylase family 4